MGHPATNHSAIATGPKIDQKNIRCGAYIPTPAISPV